MLTREAWQAVRYPADSRNVTFAVFIHANDSFETVGSVKDGRARREKIVEIYRRAKQPFIDAIHKYRKYGLEVVDEQAGTPSLIVSGPPEGWKVLFSEEEKFLEDPSIEVAPNEMNWEAL